MKQILRIALPVLIGFIVIGCSEAEPTFEERIGQSIADYYKVDSAEFVFLIDTVKVENLDSAEVMYIEANEIMEEAKVINQEKLDSAVVYASRSQEAIDECTFDMLIPIMEEQLTVFQGMITDRESDLIYADSMINVAKLELEFIEKARKNIDGNTAYFMVETQILGERKYVMINPAFEIIREL